MFFDGDSSSGVSGDLQNATMISLAMEGLWGMGGQYGSYAATRAPHDAHPVADGNDRNVLETGLGRRAEEHLASLAERTGTLLTEHRASVLAVGHALETHRTISGQDVTAIISGEKDPSSTVGRTGSWTSSPSSRPITCARCRRTAATAACRCPFR